MNDDSDNPNVTKLMLVSDNPKSDLAIIREKIQANKDLMLKSPSYDTARTIQSLTRELNAAAAAYRKKHIGIAYNYEHSLMEKLVA